MFPKQRWLEGFWCCMKSGPVGRDRGAGPPLVFLSVAGRFAPQNDVFGGPPVQTPQESPKRPQESSRTDPRELQESPKTAPIWL